MIDIKQGDWALVFADVTMGAVHEHGIAECLEFFVHSYGGWSSRPVFELFEIHRVAAVNPKTYVADMIIRSGEMSVEARCHRGNIIAIGDNPTTLIETRDRLFGIGVAAEERIEVETERRIRDFRYREKEKARAAIHRLFPHVFQA